MPVLAVGDVKSPIAEWPVGSEFFSLARQRELGGKLAGLLPLNHYGRKNLGYLEAIARGATLLFDTDDDNAPMSHWQPRGLRAQVQQVRHSGWVNVYRCFSPEIIWPRGMPLESLRECQRAKVEPGLVCGVESPIQQGLVNGSPDVDAVWRLVFDREFNFDAGPSVWLAPGSWCPFNSQSTWWFRIAFALLYLPSLVSFRVTDIWRGLVAQRCLWELSYGLVFHAPESFQQRNMHNLLHDFEQEIPAYLNSNRISSILERTQLVGGVDAIEDNLHRCYEALVAADIVPAQEMPMVEAWITDFQTCKTRSDSLVDAL